MTFDVLNPLMLLGLVGVSLPVLVHLLSRRKYDVVQWGAMQFLELEPNARRRIHLEDLLLMLLRMGLIAVVAVALARPWMSGGFLSRFISRENRDVVLVIDGSYSMGWEGAAETPHAAAIQWAHEFLEDLQPGDTVSLLETRDHVRPVIESPTRDFGQVREALNHLPPPVGSSNLAEATDEAVSLLSGGTHLTREVIVLTDGQARGWLADDKTRWDVFDDLLQQPSVRPRVWAVNVAGPWDSSGETPPRMNFHVDRLDVSRELTVPEFPVRVQTKVGYSGGETALTRRVYFEVDGQRLAENMLTVRIPPDGETSVQFEHRFNTPGSHLVSVVLDDDNLPGDNRADAAITVAEALPVLLVDGDPQLDEVHSETFFAVRALSPASNPNPLVRARVVSWDAFTGKDLEGVDVVVLANVPRLSESQVGALQDYVSQGGGLLVSLGDQVEADNYNRLLGDSGAGLLAGSLTSIIQDTAEGLGGVHVVNESLQLPWMRRFRAETGSPFTEARFTTWWQVNPIAAPADDAGSRQVERSAAAARLNTGDPLLMTRSRGRGQVVLMTAPIDADWSTLPAKQGDAFVTLLHELMFYLAANNRIRNVEAGEPLLLPVSPELPVKEFAFFGPGDTEFPPIRAGDELRPLLRLDDTRLPGVYEFRRNDADGRRVSGELLEYFVVDFDRGESDLTPLEEGQRRSLAKDGRITFVETRDELTQQMFAGESRSELWHILLLVFLVILVGEVVMTRRLVRGGHAPLVEEETEPQMNTDEHR